MTARRDLIAAICQARTPAPGYRPGTGRVTSVSGNTALVDLGGGQSITCRRLASYTPAAGQTVIIYWATDTTPVLMGALA